MITCIENGDDRTNAYVEGCGCIAIALTVIIPLSILIGAVLTFTSINYGWPSTFAEEIYYFLVWYTPL